MTLADAVTAHDEALRYGGRDGISSLHLIESGLARSGHCLTIADDEPVDDLVVAVAAGTMSFPELRTWFSARLARIATPAP